MLDQFAHSLSDPVNLLILGCLTGAAVLLLLDRVVKARRNASEQGQR